jgi:hypothetical protein
MNARAKEQLDILVLNIQLMLDTYNKMNPEFPITVDDLINHLKKKP